MNRPAMPDSRPLAVGRLAPSPTGGLHLGHARTFLAAWLSARSAGGRVVLRVEDIDASRVRPKSIDGSIADLRWIGLDWDEGPDVGGPRGPYLQSGRLPLYDAALNRLKADERVYPCTCSRADIARAASAPHAGEEGPIYPGTCAHRTAADGRNLLRPHCWRFRVNAGAVGWDDLIGGPRNVDPAITGGDFIVGRSGGEPSYQLAVVVDDAAMGVNQVIRGDDLLTSTPRQILLHRALGITEPTYGHVPLVLDADGRRLAKRDRAIKLSSLREGGLDPLRLVARLAGSLGMESGTRETPRDLVGRFRADLVPAGPWVAEVDDLLQSPG